MLIERTVAPVSTTAVARLTLSFGDEPPRHFDDPGIMITSYHSLVTALRESAVAAGADVTPHAPDDVIPGVVLDASGAQADSAGPGRGWAITANWGKCAVDGEALTYLTQPDAGNPRAVPVVVRVVPISGVTGLATVTVTTLSSRPFDQDRLSAVIRAADPRMARAVAVSPFTIYPVNAGFSPESTASGNTLLLGEAAGLTNPFTGDGISNAIRSAEIAAQAVKEHPDDPTRIADSYRAGLRSAFVGYFQSSRHAIRHYHLSWRVLSSSATSDHPFFRQSHRAALLGGSIAHESLRAARSATDPVRLHLAPFTLACNEVVVRRISAEWPLLATHTLSGRAGVHRGIRPSALLAGALMSAGADPELRHASVAAAIELALLGALAHSVPASEAGSPGRGVDWRYASSVIAADYLLAAATDVLTAARPDLAGAFAAWLVSLVTLRAEHAVESLFESFFEFPARIGAHLADADDATVSAMREFGRACGRLFLLAEDRAFLTGRGSRLDTNLAGALAAGLTGLPVRSGLRTEQEIHYRRHTLIDELETAVTRQLRAADEMLAGVSAARCQRVLEYFARALAEPGIALDEEEIR
ncbi:hypothetical protein AMK34_31320 [Amycolatopsis sp. CB00013]|nr:hypothetical protein AMK34_31320 [Amycolatopsis sp. CB00013]